MIYHGVRERRNDIWLVQKTVGARPTCRCHYYISHSLPKCLPDRPKKGKGSNAQLERSTGNGRASVLARSFSDEVRYKRKPRREMVEEISRESSALFMREPVMDVGEFLCGEDVEPAEGVSGRFVDNAMLCLAGDEDG